MSERGDGFFQRSGAGDGIIDRYFDLGWLWKWTPRAALDLTISELEIYEAQTRRILEELRPDDG